MPERAIYILLILIAIVWVIVSIASKLQEDEPEPTPVTQSIRLPSSQTPQPVTRADFSLTPEQTRLRLDSLEEDMKAHRNAQDALQTHEPDDPIETEVEEQDAPESAVVIEELPVALAAYVTSMATGSSLIYEVYKDGYPVNVSAELQWMIRDLAFTYGFDERLIYGMILAESTFNINCSTGGCYGLTQINPYWLSAASLAEYRITENYRSRDLFNAYDNLITCIEMLMYARDAYGLDLETGPDLIRILYWWNTGSDPTNVTHWAYSTKALRYAGELVEIEQ